MQPHAGFLSQELDGAAFRLEKLRSEQRVHEAAYRSALAESDMSLEELELLVAIVREWHPNLSKLARAFDRDRRKLRPMIAALENRGWLRTKRTPRRVVLAVTQAGFVAVTLAIASCRVVDAELAQRKEDSDGGALWVEDE